MGQVHKPATVTTGVLQAVCGGGMAEGIPLTGLNAHTCVGDKSAVCQVDHM